MGRGIVHAEEDGEDRGDGGTDHHDGHDGPDVLGHERNGALGDVGAAQDEVDDTGVMVFLAEVLLTNDDGEGGDQRRNDAGGRDGSHEVGAEVVGVGADAGGKSLGKQSGAGDVSSLVDRAAHVKGAHAADSQTEHDRAGGGQALQEVHHRGVDRGHGAGDTEHDETHDEGGAQRVQEDRLEAVEVLGQLGEDLLQQQDDVAGDETADDTAEEAETDTGATGVDEAGVSVDGQAGDGDHTGDEAGHEGRALADGLSDVGREHGHHEVHGDAADNLEHRGERVVLLACRVVGIDAPQERDRGEHTTGDHEDQHVGNAVHEVLIELVPDGLLLFDSLIGRSGDLGGIALGGERTVDQGASGLDGERLGDAHGDLGLTGEALGLNVLVGGDHDGTGRSDLCRRDLVLDSYLAVGLNLDGEPALSGGLLKRLLCHEGVRDAGRATGSRKNVIVLSHTSLLLQEVRALPYSGAAFRTYDAQASQNPSRHRKNSMRPHAFFTVNGFKGRKVLSER